MEATIQTILIPTDLSDQGANAVEYAVGIAKKTNAKIVLYHTYHLPTIVTDVTVVMPSLDDVENGIREGMEVLRADVIRRLGGDTSRVSYDFNPGFPKEEIIEFAKECSADLIVMGMQGSGFINEYLFGSVTVSVMRNSPCMVLAVGNQTKYKEIKHITLACDYRTIPHPEKVFAPFKSLVKSLDAHVYILHIAKSCRSSKSGPGCSWSCIGPCAGRNKPYVSPIPGQRRRARVRSEERRVGKECRSRWSP